MTLRTRRYCSLSHSDLGEVVSYGYPVPALTSDPAYPAILFPELFDLGEVVSYGYPVPAFTSDPAYPAILFPELFDLGEVVS